MPPNKGRKPNRELTGLFQVLKHQSYEGNSVLEGVPMHTTSMKVADYFNMKPCTYFSAPIDKAQELATQVYQQSEGRALAVKNSFSNDFLLSKTSKPQNEGKKEAFLNSSMFQQFMEDQNAELEPLTTEELQHMVKREQERAALSDVLPGMIKGILESIDAKEESKRLKNKRKRQRRKKRKREKAKAEQEKKGGKKGNKSNKNSSKAGKGSNDVAIGAPVVGTSEKKPKKRRNRNRRNKKKKQNSNNT
ncbi:hypothetical protein PCE1_000597 [Barthelona sp. PCE]